MTHAMPDSSSRRCWWFAATYVLLLAATVAIQPAQRQATTEAFGRVSPELQSVVLQTLNQDGGPDYALRAMPANPGRVDRFEGTNPAHEFRVAFAPDGVHVLPNSDMAPLTLRLARYGGQGESVPMTMEVWQADGARIERRAANTSHPLVEWYVNGPLGLEQGFSVPAPPPGGQTLSLQLDVNRDWTPHTSRDGAAIALRARRGGTELQYAHLHALDAAGTTLPSRLEATGTGIALTVDAAQARYPITIDPFVQQRKLAASDGAVRDGFGFSVAVSGDLALIGAPLKPAGFFIGAAYVFVRRDTVWSFEKKLPDIVLDNFTNFGRSVALSGDTAVVGAPGESTASGAAYVFVRSSAGVWSLQQKLTQPVAVPSANFGESVAIDGSTIAVGAPRDIVTTPRQGAAYIFTRSGGVALQAATPWTFQQKITAADGSADDFFGSRLALSGNTVAIGALSDDVGGVAEQGSAYVFVRSGTVWSQQNKFTETGSTLFGSAVALDGNRLLVGARAETVGPAPFVGAAYFYVRTGTSWSREQRVIADDGVRFDEFGTSVALEGDVAVVGAGASVSLQPGTVPRGRAHVVRRGAGGWVLDPPLSATDLSATFGGAVAIDGQTIVVGAREDFRDDPPGNGSAYAFVDQPGPTTLTPPVLAPAVVTTSTVRLTWNAVTGATRYQVRAGTSAGSSNAFDGDVGSVTSLTAASVPTGSYFVRVHAVGALGESTASNEVRVDVGVAGPCVVPAIPSNLTFSVAGALVTLNWVAGAGAGATSFVIEAALSSGGPLLASIDTGSSATSVIATAPRGTYFVRVRTKNSCGLSGPSNQVVIVVP